MFDDNDGNDVVNNNNNNNKQWQYGLFCYAILLKKE